MQRVGDEHQYVVELFALRLVNGAHHDVCIGYITEIFYR